MPRSAGRGPRIFSQNHLRYPLAPLLEPPSIKPADHYCLGRNLFTQITLGHGGGHVGDIPHLRRQVSCHVVHIIRQVFPGPGYAFNLGLTAQFPLGAHFPCHSGYFRGKGTQLINRLVYGAGYLSV
jgi:hypothetical protein